MGKALVIKGADFSAVAIDQLTVYDNTTLMALLGEKIKVGYGLSIDSNNHVIIQGTANSARCDIFNTSLQDYVDYGYTSLKINFANGIYNVTCIGVSSSNYNCYDKDGNTRSDGVWYTENSVLLPLSGSSKQLFVNIKKADGSNFADSTTLTDLITSVELSF